MNNSIMWSAAAPFECHVKTWSKTGELTLKSGGIPCESGALDTPGWFWNGPDESGMVGSPSLSTIFSGKARLTCSLLDSVLPVWKTYSVLSSLGILVWVFMGLMLSQPRVSKHWRKLKKDWPKPGWITCLLRPFKLIHEETEITLPFCQVLTL